MCLGMWWKIKLKTADQTIQWLWPTEQPWILKMSFFHCFPSQITLTAKFDSFSLSSLCCFILLITELFT